MSNFSVRSRRLDSKNGVVTRQRAEGGVGAAGLLAIRQVLSPRCTDSANSERTARSTSVRPVTAKATQQIILGDAELRILANLLALVLGNAVEEMRRPWQNCPIDPAHRQRPIDMVFDHAFEGP